MSRTLVFTVAAVAAIAAAAGAQSPAPTPESEAFSYRPEGRRDPFVSLVRRGGTSEVQPIRGRGLAGLLAAEVSLRGVLQNQGEIVGMLEGTDGRTYIVRPGDRLADGTIQNVLADSVVIAQQGDDPREQGREIRKGLERAGVR